MLPGAPLLLEPLEYPPPYPPPLALAKDKVGSPIRVITIIAAMSFVGFNVRVLSIDVAGQSSSGILAEVVPEKPKIREPPTEDCYLFFWFVWFFWLNETNQINQIDQLFKERPRRPCTARVQRMLVHLAYLVYLVCLVDRTGNSFRRTRQTRKTGQPDRRARARCASIGDHQSPIPLYFRLLVML